MTLDDIDELHYITPIENVGSIYVLGILSHKKAERIPHESVAMKEIQERREKVVVPGGLPLHQYVNLYFHARNPMMYLRSKQHRDLCVIRVSKSVLNIPDVAISDRNAAMDFVKFSPVVSGLKMLDRHLVFARFWTHSNPIEQSRLKGIKCAEVLVPKKVPADYLLGAYVSCGESKQTLYDIIEDIKPDIEITVNPELFFA